MAEKLPPVPHQSQIVTQASAGIITPIWSDWFKQVFARVGGNLSPTLTAASGYHMLPSGIYLQWGITASLATATTTAITFPVAFPTGCFQVIPGISGNSAGATAATGHYGSGNYTKTTFELYNRTSAPYAFNWMAVGY